MTKPKTPVPSVEEAAVALRAAQLLKGQAEVEFLAARRRLDSADNNLRRAKQNLALAKETHGDCSENPDIVGQKL